MSEKIKILIADDQKLIREGLKVILEMEEDFEIIGEAINEKLSETIRIVHKDGAIIEPSITKKILSVISKIEKEELIEELNLREIEILKFISKGYTNQEIADKLNPSVGTVKNYVTTILQTIGARDRTEAALISKEIGII